jgi:hypothetical protein
MTMPVRNRKRDNGRVFDLDPRAHHAVPDETDTGALPQAHGLCELRTVHH